MINKKILTTAALITTLSTTSQAAIDTIWNFDTSLDASTGTASLSYRGDMASNVNYFASEHEVGLAMPYGDNGSLMQFPATLPEQGLTVNLNNGGNTVTDYTMLWDVFRPAYSWNSYMPLYQTDFSNTTDGDFFVNPNGGIGISGQYSGRVSDRVGDNVWNRIAVTRSSDGTMKKYIDGQLVGTQIDTAGSRWDITNGQFSILTDNDNESAAGFISSYRFTDSIMTDSQIAELGNVHASGTGVNGQGLTADPSILTPGSYTIVVIGDTQNYSSGRPEIFNTVTQWIADNKDTRNIQFAIQDGDIVNNQHSSTQWDVSRAAMDKLNGIVPYAVVRGNHDASSQYDQSDRYGNGSPYSQQPTLTGHYENPAHPEQDMRNTFHTFEANGQKMLVLTIDISAGSGVVEWANQVVEEYADHRVILDTHAYNYDGGSRFNNAIDPETGESYDRLRDHVVGHDNVVYNGAQYGGQDAETLWNQLVSKHENISMFISGHQFENYDQFKYHLDQGDNGNDVFELLVDPQAMENGGDGWIRLLEFDPDGETVHVKTYSPYRDEWDTSFDVYYDIKLSDIPEPTTLSLLTMGSLALLKRKSNKNT